MEEMKKTLEELIGLMGFKDFSVSVSEESKRLSVFINDAPFLSWQVPQMVADLDFVLKMIAKKKELGMVFVDVNNHRKEREDLIVKLAKATAKKAMITKEEISLPPMNAYERRIIHAELAMNPDLKTESAGEGKGRHVVVKPIGGD